MKCKACNGTGKIKEIDFSKPDWKDIEKACPICCGSGVIEQNNEEWAKSLDTEHFAKLLADAMWYGGQCDKDDVTCEECGCPWCKTDTIREWLKQPHKEDNT